MNSNIESPSSQREPAHLRPDYPPADRTLQVRRFATRMQPWLLEPHVHIVKATLSPSSPSFNPADPNRIIGHAAWQMPGRTQQQVVNFWRADAGEKLGWSEKMGWSKEEEDELWSGTDLELWQKGFLEWDEFRERRVGGKGHWWVAFMSLHDTSILVAFVGWWMVATFDSLDCLADSDLTGFWRHSG